METFRSPAPDCESGRQENKHHKENSNTKNKKVTLIPINDIYSIGADKHCWKIIERVTRKRNGVLVSELKPIKWFKSLENVLNGLANYRLRIAGAATLIELQKEQEKILRELSEAFYLYIDGESCRSNIKAEIMQAFNNGEMSASCVKSLFSLLKLGEV